MTPAKGLVAQGADNTGAAPVWGGPVDFVTLAQGLALQKAQDTIAREKQRLDAEARRREKFQGLDYKPAWDRSHQQFQQERNTMYEAFNALGGMNTNWDDPTSEAGKLMQDSQKRLNTLADMDQKQKELYFSAIESYNEDPTQYEPDFYEKLEAFDQIPTIEGREQFIRENNFLDKIWDKEEYLGRILVGVSTRKGETPTGASSSTGITEKDVRAAWEADLLTPQGRADFEKGVKKGIWKNTEEMYQWTLKAKKAAADKATSYEQKEVKDDNGGWGAGNTFNNGTVIASGSVQPSGEDTGNKATRGGMSAESRGTTLKRVTLSNDKGKEIPPMYLETKGGDRVFTQVTGIDKQNGQWVITGRRVKELSATEARRIGFDVSTVDNDGNTIYFKTLENVNIEYDRNSSALSGKTGGFNVYDYERNFNKNFQQQAQQSVKGEEAYFKDVVLNMNNTGEEAVAARETALQAIGANSIKIGTISKAEEIKRLREEKDKLTKEKKDATYIDKIISDLQKREAAAVYRFKYKGQTYIYDTSKEDEALQLKKFLEAARK
jgi:hypothetical protein